MIAIRRSWRRLLSSFGGTRADRDLDQELASHLELHVANNLKMGMSPADARRRALLALGGVESNNELVRDRRSWPRVAALARDVRFGARAVAKRPLLLLATTLSLAVGVA